MSALEKMACLGLNASSFLIRVKREIYFLFLFRPRLWVVVYILWDTPKKNAYILSQPGLSSSHDRKHRKQGLV